MSSKIRVLPEDVINKIAAGEVIENPASVVKELVDNSIDAGADEIVVEISSGGRQLIRISDNGCGMIADDALLCLERHGTSKIRDIDDLFSLSTMGFRGEAVPSIASISKFTLMTCPKAEGDQPQMREGTMVIVEGGKILKACPAVRDPGTTIEVKSLFYNVPVRRKFQKSPAYDTGEILKIVSLLALANPSVKFQLISDQKMLLSTSLAKGKPFQEMFNERIISVLGADYLDDSLAVFNEKGEYRLEGVIGKPSHTRPNRTGQHLFLNQRPIWSTMISHAVREGYGTMLPTQRFPVFALHLTMPGDLVDVNVHPQKREVRLRHEQEIKQMVIGAVSQALRTCFAEPPAESFYSAEPPVSNSFIQRPFSMPDPVEFEPKPQETPWLLNSESAVFPTQIREEAKPAYFRYCP